MGWNKPDVYYQPEKFGLTIVAEDDQDDSYGFDKFVVWKDVNSNLYWSTDSGCSCPSPFEAHGAVADLDYAKTAQDVLREYQAWYAEKYTKDENLYADMVATLMQL